MKDQAKLSYITKKDIHEQAVELKDVLITRQTMLWLTNWECAGEQPTFRHSGIH